MDYARKLSDILAGFSGTTPKILLHSCCAVCSGYVLAYLSRCAELDVFYFNPNIYPGAEYALRKSEQQRLIRESEYPHRVRYIDAGYDYALFLAAAAGLEAEPEGGARCARCFALRLNKTAEYAAQQGGYDYIATTLTVSPHKNAAAVNTAGEQAAARHGVRWLPGDFKKQDGFRHANRIAQEKEIYRQDYCGCRFSIREKKV